MILSDLCEQRQSKFNYTTIQEGIEARPLCKQLKQNIVIVIPVLIYFRPYGAIKHSISIDEFSQFANYKCMN